MSYLQLQLVQGLDVDWEPLSQLRTRVGETHEKRSTVVVLKQTFPEEDPLPASLRLTGRRQGHKSMQFKGLGGGGEVGRVTGGGRGSHLVPNDNDRSAVFRLTLCPCTDHVGLSRTGVLLSYV